MTVSRRWALLCLALSLGSLAGCASMGARDRADKLDQAMRRFEKGVRWAEYPLAEALIRPRTPPARRVSSAELEGIRVTRFEYVRQQPAPDAPEEIEAVAVIDAYSVTDGVVFSVTDRQRWYFDEEAGGWFVDGTLPALNAR